MTGKPAIESGRDCSSILAYFAGLDNCLPPLPMAFFIGQAGKLSFLAPPAMPPPDGMLSSFLLTNKFLCFNEYQDWGSYG
jgi:hypothetical protein